MLTNDKLYRKTERLSHLLKEYNAYTYQPIYIETSNLLVQSLTSAATVLISVTALFVALWSLRIQRTHTRKSVRPVGHVQLQDLLDGLKVEIVNKGCGPMLIKEFIAIRGEICHHNLLKHLPENSTCGFDGKARKVTDLTMLTNRWFGIRES